MKNFHFFAKKKTKCGIELLNVLKISQKSENRVSQFLDYFTNILLCKEDSAFHYYLRLSHHIHISYKIPPIAVQHVVALLKFHRLSKAHLSFYRKEKENLCFPWNIKIFFFFTDKQNHRMVLLQTNRTVFVNHSSLSFSDFSSFILISSFVSRFSTYTLFFYLSHTFILTWGFTTLPYFLLSFYSILHYNIPPFVALFTIPSFPFTTYSCRCFNCNEYFI